MENMKSESTLPGDVKVLIKGYREELDRLLAKNVEVIQSKSANRIAELRIKLRELGATDIP